MTRRRWPTYSTMSRRVPGLLTSRTDVRSIQGAQVSLGGVSRVVGGPLKQRFKSFLKFYPLLGEFVLDPGGISSWWVRVINPTPASSSRRFERVELLATERGSRISPYRSVSRTPIVLTICVAYFSLSVSMMPSSGR